MHTYVQSNCHDPNLHAQAPRREAGGHKAPHRRSRGRPARQRRSGADDAQHDRGARRRAAPYALRAFSRRAQPLSRPPGLGIGERIALPDAEPWRAIADRRARLRAGFSAIYGWYQRNAALIGCVLRDAEHHALTREITEMRFAPHIAAWHEVLGVTLTATQRAVLHLGLSFFTWRTLRDGGLDTAAAVAAMVQAVDGAGR